MYLVKCVLLGDATKNLTIQDIQIIIIKYLTLYPVKELISTILDALVNTNKDITELIDLKVVLLITGFNVFMYFSCIFMYLYILCIYVFFMYFLCIYIFYIFFLYIYIRFG